jgi:hypothetical protein
MTSALLVISKRSIKRQGQARKDIVVPTISIPETMGALMAGASAPMLTAGATLPPPPALPADPSFARGFAIPVDRALPTTYDELARLIRDSQVSTDHAGATFRRLFPDVPSAKDLTDDQRGRLWQAIAEPPGEAETAPLFDDDLAGLPTEWQAV